MTPKVKVEEDKEEKEMEKEEEEELTPRSRSRRQKKREAIPKKKAKKTVKEEEEEKEDEVKDKEEESVEVKEEKCESPVAKKPSPKKKTPSPEKKVSPEKKEKKPVTMASFFGLSQKDSPKDKNASNRDYDASVQASRYHPIDDAIWKKGEKTPYLAFAKTLKAIEATSGRLKTIEILANYLRSVMVLSPSDLLPSVYLCLNRLAPAYEGIELGIGDMYLIKAIAQTTGRSAQQIKADISKLGDLGIVAESSRGSQRTMFQPAPLTVVSVFEKLKDIAKMSGHASMNHKVSKIQSMLVACKEEEARYLIRSLAGKLRIGLAEQSVLQALAHACVMTPPCQPDYPPKILSAFKDCSTDAFKEALEKEALPLKTAYW